MSIIPLPRDNELNELPQNEVVPETWEEYLAELNQTILERQDANIADLERPEIPETFEEYWEEINQSILSRQAEYLAEIPAGLPDTSMTREEYEILQESFCIVCSYKHFLFYSFSCTNY
mgnify:CR=1 FL=1